MLFKCIIISFLSLETVQVLYAAETGGKSKWLDDNGQKCLASNGKPCHFPFMFNRKVLENAVVEMYFKSIPFFRFIHLAQRPNLTTFGAAQKVSILIFNLCCLMS